MPKFYIFNINNFFLPSYALGANLKDSLAHS